MSAAGIAQLVLSAVILLIFIGFLVWGVRTRQFRDIEQAKYVIFEEDDDSEQGTRDE